MVNNAPPPKTLTPEEQPALKTSPIKNIDKIKLSLESPSQIQQSIQMVSDLSPSEINPVQFTSITPSNEPPIPEIKEEPSAVEKELNRSPNHTNPQNEDFIKQNILENDIFDSSVSTSSSNDLDDDDSDNKFSTIKRSPHSKNNVSDSSDGKEHGDLSRQNTVIENINYKDGNEHTNGNSTPDGKLIKKFVHETKGCIWHNFYSMFFMPS